MAEEFEDLSFSETGCEVRVQGEWTLVELSQVLKLDPVRIKRCPECHGQVRLIKAITAKFGSLKPAEAPSRISSTTSRTRDVPQGTALTVCAARIQNP
jgi:hypothetical protein